MADIITVRRENTIIIMAFLSISTQMEYAPTKNCKKETTSAVKRSTTKNYSGSTHSNNSGSSSRSHSQSSGAVSESDKVLTVKDFLCGALALLVLLSALAPIFEALSPVGEFVLGLIEEIWQAHPGLFVTAIVTLLAMAVAHVLK